MQSFHIFLVKYKIVYIFIKNSLHTILKNKSIINIIKGKYLYSWYFCFIFKYLAK